MKFILRKDRLEGGSIDINESFISYGRCKVNTYEIIRHEDGTVEDCPVRDDGWYFRIVTPFSRVKNYLNPATFEDAVGPCRFAFSLRRRTNRITKEKMTYHSKLWVPVDQAKDQQEIRYDDPYLHAVTIKDKL